jgi:hypothetical protein
MALMCGGSFPSPPGSKNTQSREKLYGIISWNVLQAVDHASMDCWWLRITPQAGWDRVALPKSTAGPPARAWHAAAWESDGDNVIVFGGSDINGTALNDCWFLPVPALQTVAAATAAGGWQSCDPINGTWLMPAPRWGHTAVVFGQAKALFVFGGYGAVEAAGGQQTFALNDVWRLDHFSNASRAWTEVEPSTSRPPSRAFHAAWLLGDIKMIVHGGESKRGSGETSVLSDTWRFDFLTGTWTMYPPDSSAPPLLHAAAARISPTSALLFGGTDDNRQTSGSVKLFSSGHGWSRMSIAGDRPSRRSGSILAALDSSASRLLMSHGVAVDGKTLLNDTWVLDLAAGTAVPGSQVQWRCLRGDTPGCVSASRPAAPAPPRTAYTAFAVAGRRLFTFGGAASLFPIAPHDQMWTAPLGALPPAWAPVDISGVTALHPYPITDGEENDPSDRIAQNPFAADVRPAARTHAEAVAVSPLAGFAAPLVLVGGLDIAGLPLDDIWVIDTAERVGNGTAGAHELVFDGVQDIVSVPLPAFLQSPSGLGALWVEVWIRLNTFNSFQNMIVVDLEDTNGIPAFRLTLSSSDSGYSAALLFYPSDPTIVTTIKTWAPITAAAWTSAWHHLALTLRFARVNRPGSSDPNAAVAQAFLFVDGEAIRDDGSFLAIDVLTTLVLRTGLTVAFFGGPSDTLELLQKYSSLPSHIKRFIFPLSSSILCIMFFKIQHLTLMTTTSFRYPAFY